MAEIYTTTEQEVIVLKAVWEQIDEMVNYEMFAGPNRAEDAQLVPKSRTHQRLFNVLLVDFLSKPSLQLFELQDPPRESSVSEQSFLFYLRSICGAPKLNPVGGESIRMPLDAFEQWLEGICTVEKVWFPSIEVETDLRLKRVHFVKICGNIGKHGFARLSRIVEVIRGILADNGVNISLEQSFLVIPEFYAWFHEHIFNYHISAIAEFLNNIRWGIHDYLKPEFDRSYTREEPPSIKYRFTYPAECTKPIARSMYWDLMNEIRSEPLIAKFEVTRYLKMRY